jgi:alpha-galactosidase
MAAGPFGVYNWWFRKRPDLIQKYCTHATGANPGEYGYSLKVYKAREKTRRKLIRDWLNDCAPMDFKRGHEYVAYIVNVYVGDDPFEFNGNVPNTGIIPNLPSKMCVEVPVLVNRRGFNPIHVGILPPQCVALNNSNIAVEEMAVEAALTGDPELVH